jgi:hypothetical protein
MGVLSAAKVNELHFAHWAAQKTGAKALEFFDGIGGEAVDLGGLIVPCCIAGSGAAVE